MNITQTTLIGALCTILLIYSKQSTEDIITDLYKGISGFGLPEQEVQMMHNEDAAPTYGEITFQGAKQLIDYLSLKPTDIFYDLGCGVGKFVVQVYLNSPVKKAVGVELAPKRYNYAQSIKRKMKEQQLFKPGHILFFKRENIKYTNLSNATHIFMCSTCFSNILMKELTYTIIQQTQPGTIVITLKRLWQDDRFDLEKTMSVPMTWSKNSAIYIYRLK